MNHIAYDKSIFKQFFLSTDGAVVGWRDRMLDKLYNRGIIPEYIQRGESLAIDEDYISFWTAVSEYYAYYVVYARKFLDLENDRELLLDYLYDKNVGEAPDGLIAEMQYLMNKLYDDTRLRGTAKVFERVPTGSPYVFDGVHLSDVVVNSEFARSIAMRYIDEYMIMMTSQSNYGWCISRSSPMYRGTLQDYQLIKAYEDTDYAVDKTKYPLINPAGVAVVNDTVIGKDVLEFHSSPMGATGIGLPTVKPSKLIVIDPAVNYEITFQCLSSVGAKATFGVRYYDEFFNPIPSNYIDGSTSSGLFFNGQSMWRDNEYYFIRGISFGVNTPIRPTADSILDFGVGQHMQTPCGAVYMLPSLVLDAGVSKKLLVYDFKVRISDTVYSRGFIQTPNVIQVWAKNNNGLYSTEFQPLLSVIHPISYVDVITIPLLEEFIRRYLIPYNSTIVFNWLSNATKCNTPEPKINEYDESYDISFS